MYGPVVDEGRNAGIIGVGGLVLARIPVTNWPNSGIDTIKVFQKINWTQWIVTGCVKTTQPCLKLNPQRKSSVSFRTKRTREL